MSDLKNRLAEGARLLTALKAARGRRNPARAVARQLVARELRELEKDILADPGALQPLLVPVRRRRSQRSGE